MSPTVRCRIARAASIVENAPELQVPRPDATATGSVPSTGGFLSAADVRALTDVALRLERELDSPQAVEWSIDDDGRLWVVQTRPITATSEAPLAPGGSVLWSKANINENFPEPRPRPDRAAAA